MSGSIEINEEALMAMVKAQRPTTSMAMGKVNADWFKALVAAQAALETVGKDGAVTVGNAYKYATAENMIRGSRKPLTDNGLAFFSTWSTVPVKKGDQADTQGIGQQTVGAMVTMHWVLSHEDGGYVSGTADMAAICSPRRPSDKAVAATLTYMRGFVLRDLLNMDREEEASGAVDQRDDSYQNGNGNGNGNGRRDPDQRTPEQVEAEKADAYARATKPLKERAMKLAKELEDKISQGFPIQRKAAGVPEKGRLSIEDLKKFNAWAARKLDQVDGHHQEPAEDPADEDQTPPPEEDPEAPPADVIDPETGEVIS